MDLAKNIISIRESKSITQAEMAVHLDIDQSNYSRLESKGSKLTIEQAERIAKALGVGLDVLLGIGDAEGVKKTEEKLEAAKLHLIECYTFFNYLTKIFVTGELSELPPEQVTIAQINKLWVKSISVTINDKEKIKQINIDSPLRLALVHFGDIRVNFQNMRDNIWGFVRKLLPPDDPRLQQKEH